MTTEDRMRQAFDSDESRPLVQIAAFVADEMVAEATAELSAHLDVMSTYVETSKNIAAARKKQLADALMRVEGLKKALRKIIDADDEYRRSLPPDWDSDPVTAACNEARAALAAGGGQ